MLAQSQGLLPTEYSQLGDPLSWLGILALILIALALLAIAALRWRERRHQHITESHDELDLKRRAALNDAEVTAIAHTETTVVRLEEKLDAKDAQFVAFMERELAEEKKKSAALLNEVLARRAREEAAHLAASADPLDRERGERIVRAIDDELEHADEPGVGSAVIRRIEQASEVHISEASDAEEERPGREPWPTKKKRR